jgi:hypothetical protein
MAYGAMHEIGPWRRSSLTIPPNSARAWLHLACWEIWMGVLLCGVVALGSSLVLTSPDRIFAVSDISACYAPPPVTLPCERILYRGGLLNAAFTALSGVLLLGLAAWLVCELWSAVEPKPITDDFIMLLNDSFGREWRNPLTWPWSRALWAYGFTMVGVALTAGASLMLWTLLATQAGKAPTARVNTSQSFTLAP